METLVTAICLASVVIMWGVVATGSCRVLRMYRAAGAPPDWRASVHAPRWWAAIRLLTGFSGFIIVPLVAVNRQYWALGLFCAWCVQIIVRVIATHAVADESEGAGG